MLYGDLSKKIEEAFNESPELFCRINDTVNKYGMQDHIKNGVIVGFSGGPDSVLLLIFLYKLQKQIDFPLLAVHVNHKIRQVGAKKDEDFSRLFCESLGVEFRSFEVDVPAYATDMKLGTEDAARRKRYEIFSQVCNSEKSFNSVATAHNATDNLETLIFRLMRGAGAKGLLGISPVRDNIIRPLIDLSKSEIVGFLDKNNIPYVLDETNFSCEYTRNYIRHEILPKLSRLNPNPENAAARVIENLRDDFDYVESVADAFIKKNSEDGGIAAEKLAKLHSAVLSRVVIKMAETGGGATLEAVHVTKIKECLLKGGSFEVSIPGRRSFARNGDFCFIKNENSEENGKKEPFCRALSYGFNEIPELNLGIALTKSKFEVFSSNVYKISIQADLYSAIIKDTLFVRRREDGDAYFYGGMNRRLKKLFNDKKIPIAKRSEIPIVCDASGIVWVPGFGVRSDRSKNESGEHIWVTVYEKQ